MRNSFFYLYLHIPNYYVISVVTYVICIDIWTFIIRGIIRSICESSFRDADYFIEGVEAWLAYCVLY